MHHPSNLAEGLHSLVLGPEPLVDPDVLHELRVLVGCMVVIHALPPFHLVQALRVADRPGAVWRRKVSCLCLSGVRWLMYVLV